MQSATETITPDMAARYLATSAGNRGIRDRLVESISRDMIDGKWDENGETIKFDKNGRLIDGHHRLNGCVKAGVPFTTLVTRGASAGNIDIGAKRTLADRFAFEGMPNYRVLASAARVLAAFLAEKPYERFEPSQEEMSKVVRDNPDMQKYVSRVFGLYNQLHLPTGDVAAIWYLMAKKDSILADMFFEQLFSGEDLCSGDPILLLRNRLISNATSAAKLNKRHLMALLIKTWNHTRQGNNKLKQLKWKRVSEDGGEKFPNVA
jgi:hypothetical protein